MQCMAQEGSEASVASSPPQPPPSASSSTTSSAAAPSWWRDMHPSAYAVWPPPQPPTTVATRWPPLAASHHQHHHRSSSSGAEDDLSASNMTGAGGEVGRSMQAVHDAHDDSENFLELLNSRTLAPELFAEPPACDYLKKMEYGSNTGGVWTDHHNFTALEKHLGAGYGNALAHQHQHAANLSDLVSNWSIAPPNPSLGDRAGGPCDNAVGHGANKAGFFLDSGGGVKHEMSGHNAAAMLQHEAAGGANTSAAGQEFLRPMGYSSMLGLGSHRTTMYGGAMDVPWGTNNAGAARSLTDLISFGAAQGKPEPLAVPAKTAAEFKKQGQEISSPAKTSSGGGSRGSSAASEGKKKRSEEQQGSEGNAKKSKSDSSSPTSSLKSSQLPKVKLGDKITALQQIVSPFGKLLSDPYMKTTSSKVKA
ncbi:hypothetical protein PR202_ga25320 [Eleusine coracana subsp. coracana]|uniref:Uncharacterized protein n=1 Tax=Eleusine coracana subsp. coracana TaxID=191504 RepID=A0AAV5D921_ELECO|nr:hypothetical protein PR202_ga25320 [Eleusine coracana subsp. coracana]